MAAVLKVTRGLVLIIKRMGMTKGGTKKFNHSDYGINQERKNSIINADAKIYLAFDKMFLGEQANEKL